VQLPFFWAKNMTKFFYGQVRTTLVLLECQLTPR
jgi:hypothetical protein